MVAGDGVAAGVDGAIIQEGTIGGHGGEVPLLLVVAVDALVHGGDMEETKDGGATVEQAEGGGPNGDASGEVIGAINGVDHPAPFGVGEGAIAFFCQKAVVGEGAGNGVFQFAISPFVGAGDDAAISFGAGSHLGEVLHKLGADPLSDDFAGVEDGGPVGGGHAIGS